MKPLKVIGSITDKRKDEIFNALKNSSRIESVIPTSSETSIEKEIKITKLIHKNGVNALINNQTIKFSNHITILYGMNGTGKSSYFKILNELAGGNQKK